MPDADCPPFADHPAKTQDVVWNEINKKNRSFDARPATEAYRAVLNLEEGNARERITPYAVALSERLERTPHPVVGVVAAVDGKVIAADIFGDPALFRKFWPKLLLSYAADAAERAPDEDGATPAAAATPEQAKAFLARGFNVTDSSRAGTMLRFESREAIAYRLTESGDGTRLVHESVVRK